MVQKNSSMLLSFTVRCRSKSINKTVNAKNEVLHLPGADLFVFANNKGERQIWTKINAITFRYRKTRWI